GFYGDGVADDTLDRPAATVDLGRDGLDGDGRKCIERWQRPLSESWRGLRGAAGGLWGSSAGRGTVRLTVAGRARRRRARPRATVWRRRGGRAGGVGVGGGELLQA